MNEEEQQRIVERRAWERQFFDSQVKREGGFPWWIIPLIALLAKLATYWDRLQ